MLGFLVLLAIGVAFLAGFTWGYVVANLDLRTPSKVTFSQPTHVKIVQPKEDQSDADPDR